MPGITRRPQNGGGNLIDRYVGARQMSGIVSEGGDRHQHVSG